MRLNNHRSKDGRSTGVQLQNLEVTKITDDRGLNRETQISQRTRVFGDDRVIRSMGRGDPAILGATEDMIMIITK